MSSAAAMAKGKAASAAKRGGVSKDPADALLPDKRRRGMDDSDHEFDSDMKEIVTLLRHIKDKAHKDGQKKTEQAISSVATEIQTMVQDTKTKIEKERQNFLKALSKTSKECEGLLKNEYTKFQATHDKFCKDKAAHIQNFKGRRPERAMSSSIPKHLAYLIFLNFLSSVSLCTINHAHAHLRYHAHASPEARFGGYLLCVFFVYRILLCFFSWVMLLLALEWRIGQHVTCSSSFLYFQSELYLFSKFEEDREKLLMQYELQRKKEKSTLSELEKTFSEKMASAEESLKKMKQDDKSLHILRKSIGSFLDPEDQFGQDDD